MESEAAIRIKATVVLANRAATSIFCDGEFEYAAACISLANPRSTNETNDTCGGAVRGRESAALHSSERRWKESYNS
jgi:hypothetical protein